MPRSSAGYSEVPSFPVDAVVLWVDGNDPEWLASRNRYLQGTSNTGTGDYRFRDWGLMRYWFRGIEEFAPWFRRIYLVTCGQRPEWLVNGHPKLVEVRHDDYIPHEFLPTFNSNVIEIYLNRIEGLSEHFVLFNDDMFITSLTTRDDFFSDGGMPRDAAVLGTIASPRTESIFPFAQLNNSSIINSHFDLHDVLKREWRKFFSPKYGRDLLRNLVLSKARCVSMFHNYHLPQPLLRSVMDEVWAAEPEMLIACAVQRFRSRDDVSQYLFRMWQCCSGRFEPRSPRVGHSFVIGRDPDLYETIESGRYKMICANDDLDGIDFEGERTRLDNTFNTLLPNKSSFEL